MPVYTMAHRGARPGVLWVLHHLHLHLQTRGPYQKQLCTVCALPQIVSRAHVVPQVLSDSLALQAERDSWSWQRALPARRAPPADVHPAGASSSCP